MKRQLGIIVSLVQLPLVDAIAVTGVEAFFVLSGFVLAPQILTMIIGGPAGYPPFKYYGSRATKLMIARTISAMSERRNKNGATA
jgi:peptidoglycan/LPS O-acetylase OafA/YrhL